MQLCNHADTQPVKRINLKRLRNIYTILNLQFCWCERMR